MAIRNRVLIGIVLVTAIVFGVFPVLESQAASKPTVLKIGHITALTGPAAFWGINNYRGMILGMEKLNAEGGFTINGKKYIWEIIAYDHMYVPAEAVKRLHKAIYRDKINFAVIMGGAPTAACVPLLKKAEILSLNNSNVSDDVLNKNNPLLFQYNYSMPVTYATLIPWFKSKKGVKKWACINPDDETGHQGSFRWCKLYAERNGVKIVAHEFYERGTTDFYPMLTRIIAAKPDLIETAQSDPKAACLQLKQARELGYKGLFCGTWGTNPEDMIKVAGKQNAEGAYYCAAGPATPVTAAQKKVYQQYLAKGWPEKEWTPMVLSFYEIVSMLTEGIKAAGKVDDPYKIADALENVVLPTSVLGSPLMWGQKSIYGVKRSCAPTGLIGHIVKGKRVDIEPMTISPELMK